MLKWVVSQMPVRLMVLPEAARNAVVAAATLAYAHRGQPGGVNADLVGSVLARAAATTLLSPMVCALCHGRGFTALHLPPVLSTSRSRLGRAADSMSRRCNRLAMSILPEEVLSASALTGVSMGGTGAYRQAVLHPDVFAAAAPVENAVHSAVRGCLLECKRLLLATLSV